MGNGDNLSGVDAVYIADDGLVMLENVHVQVSVSVVCAGDTIQRFTGPDSMRFH